MSNVVANLEDRFSRDEDHMYISTESMDQIDLNRLTNNEMESIVRARSTFKHS